MRCRHLAYCLLSTCLLCCKCHIFKGDVGFFEEGLLKADYVWVVVCEELFDFFFYVSTLPLYNAFILHIHFSGIYFPLLLWILGFRFWVFGPLCFILYLFVFLIVNLFFSNYLYVLVLLGLFSFCFFLLVIFMLMGLLFVFNCDFPVFRILDLFCIGVWLIFVPLVFTVCWVIWDVLSSL